MPRSRYRSRIASRRRGTPRPWRERRRSDWCWSSWLPRPISLCRCCDLSGKRAARRKRIDRTLAARAKADFAGQEVRGPEKSRTDLKREHDARIHPAGAGVKRSAAADALSPAPIAATSEQRRRAAGGCWLPAAARMRCMMAIATFSTCSCRSGRREIGLALGDRAAVDRSIPARRRHCRSLAGLLAETGERGLPSRARRVAVLVFCWPHGARGYIRCRAAGALGRPRRQRGRAFAEFRSYGVRSFAGRRLRTARATYSLRYVGKMLRFRSDRRSFRYGNARRQPRVGLVAGRSRQRRWSRSAAEAHAGRAGAGEPRAPGQALALPGARGAQRGLSRCR